MTNTHISTTVPISTQVFSAASRNAASGWATFMKSACNKHKTLRFNRHLTRITVYITPTQWSLPGLPLCISCQTAGQRFPQWRHQEDVCKPCGPETLLPWEPDTEPSGNRQDCWALILQTNPENKEERTLLSFCTAKQGQYNYSHAKTDFQAEGVWWKYLNDINPQSANMITQCAFIWPEENCPPPLFPRLSLIFPKVFSSFLSPDGV